MPHLPPALEVLVVALTLVAAVYDLRERRIPNWLSVTGMLVGVLANVMLAGVAGLKAAGLGFALAALVYVPLFLLRAVGGGDVKLMAAVGAIAGPGVWLAIFFATALVGGAAALVLTLWRGRLRRTLYNIAFILWELTHFRAPHHSRDELDVANPKALRLPHAIVIAGATLLLLGAGRLR